MATAAATLEQHHLTPGPRLGLVGRLALSVLIMGTLGALAGVQLAAALDPAATGAGRSFDPSPAITSRSTGDASFTDLAPGATTIERTTVRLGEARAAVGLHATIDGTGLERFIDVRIVQDADQDGAGWVVFEGTLAGLPRTASGAIDLGTWAEGSERTFRVETTLRDANAAQGLTSPADLVFTATPPR